MKYITPILIAILTLSTLSLHQKFENATVKPKEARNVFELSGRILSENSKLKAENAKLKRELKAVPLRDPLYALEVGR